MATLAIRGHKTRGKEVIKILEMLGGENRCEFEGNCFDAVFYIEYKEIRCGHPRLIVGIKWFTLEEFLEKFPYKVGDKVLYKIYNVYSSIKSMTWNEEKEQVIYLLDSQKLWVATADELEKVTMEKTIKTITIEDFKANTKEWLIDKLESMSKDDALHTICDLHDELHKPQFPTTYEDCCKVLNKTTYIGFDGLSLGEVELYKPFVKLMRCRNAYWKVGDWKPNWEDDTNKYVITNYNNHIILDVRWNSSAKLSFPNKEIRGAFYENFKELIEECKVLL